MKQRHGNTVTIQPPTAKAKVNKGGRPVADSVTLQITTTKPMIQHLDLVVATGFFGTSRPAAVERLLGEALRGLLKEGIVVKSDKVLSAS